MLLQVNFPVPVKNIRLTSHVEYEKCASVVALDPEMSMKKPYCRIA